MLHLPVTLEKALRLIGFGFGSEARLIAAESVEPAWEHFGAVQTISCPGNGSRTRERLAAFVFVTAKRSRVRLRRAYDFIVLP